MCEKSVSNSQDPNRFFSGLHIEEQNSNENENEQTQITVTF